MTDDNVILTKLGPDTLRELDRIALEEGLSPSETATRLLREAIWRKVLLDEERSKKKPRARFKDRT